MEWLMSVVRSSEDRDWIWELCDWETAEPYGELDTAKNISLQTGIKANPTLSLETPMWGSHPLREIVELDRLLLSARRWDPVAEEYACQFIGPVVAKTKRMESGMATLGLTAWGPFWRLMLRIADKTGNAGLTEHGLSINWGQRAKIAAQLIQWTNDLKGTSWVYADPATVSSSGDWMTDGWGGMRTVAESISELSDTADGFEWTLSFNPRVESGKLYLADFVALSALGESRVNDVHFDWSPGGSNCSDVQITDDLDNLANVTYHVVSEGSPYIVEQSNGVSKTRFGIFESVVDASLTDTGLRQSLVDAHAAVRGGMRKIVQITPQRSDTEADSDVAAPFLDYGLGDLVGVRAEWADRVDVDGAVRVHGITVEVTETGEERATLELRGD